MTPLLLAILLALCPAWAQDPATPAPASPRAVERVEAPAPTAFDGARWALVIGVDDYDDPEITDLQYAGSDARALSAQLVETGGYDLDHVVLMHSRQDDPDLRPTRTNILLQLARLARRAEGASQVLVFYSGHGMGREVGAGDRRNYLLPADTRLEVPESTALGLDEVLRSVESINAQQRIVILDACRNQMTTGARALGSPNPLSEAPAPLASGTRVLYSSGFGAVSYEEPSLGMGAFSWWLVDGLRCAADGALDGSADGTVTLDELFRYTSERLRHEARPGREQTPVLAGEASGDFVLAQVSVACENGRIPRPELWDQASFRRAAWLGAGGAVALAATVPTKLAWEGDGGGGWRLSNYGAWTLGVGLSASALVLGSGGLVRWRGDLVDWRRRYEGAETVGATAENERPMLVIGVDPRQDGGVVVSLSGRW